MNNAYNEPGAEQRFIVQANQTRANILINPQACRLFIANDTKELIAFDKDLNPIIGSAGNYLLLDQTTPQTIINGSPIFGSGIDFLVPSDTEDFPIISSRQAGYTTYGWDITDDNKIDGNLIFWGINANVPKKILALERYTGNVLIPALTPAGIVTNTANGLLGTSTFASLLGTANGISGTLTTGYFPVATGAHAIGDSLVSMDGDQVGIGGGLSRLKTWHESSGVHNSLEFYGRNSVYSNSIGFFGLFENVYFNAGYKLCEAGTASDFLMYDQSFHWNVFATGTKNSAATSVPHMCLDANSNLSIGHGSPISRLDIMQPDSSTFSLLGRFTGSAHGVTDIIPATDAPFGIVTTGTLGNGSLTTRIIGITGDHTALAFEGVNNAASGPVFVIDGARKSGTGRAAMSSGNILEILNNGSAAVISFGYDGSAIFNGNMKIGSAAPLAKLSISGSSGNYTSLLNGTDLAINVSGAQNNAALLFTNGTTIKSYIYGNNNGEIEIGALGTNQNVKVHPSGSGILNVVGSVGCVDIAASGCIDCATTIVDYSNDCTVYAFSVVNSKTIKYIKSAGFLHLWYNIDGTTSDIIVNFSLPFASKSGVALTYAVSTPIGNCYLYIADGGTVANILSSSSGAKVFRGYICYPV